MKLIEAQFNQNWHSQALYWWRMYLKQRVMVKHLRKQNRQLRKILFDQFHHKG